VPVNQVLRQAMAKCSDPSGLLAFLDRVRVRGRGQTVAEFSKVAVGRSLLVIGGPVRHSVYGTLSS